MRVIGKMHRLASTRELQVHRELQKKAADLETLHQVGDEVGAKLVEHEMDRLARTWAAWHQLKEYAKGNGL